VARRTLSPRDPDDRTLEIRRLGRVGYGAAFELQQALVEQRKQGEISDTLLLLEHPPVITEGRDAKPEHILADGAALAAAGVERVEANRGGDVTYHGPGQIVGYLIMDLRPDWADIPRFVRGMEQAMIDACADFGWLEDPPRKLGQIGARISRWVSYHGFALNVAPDLAHFDLIVPCGIRDRGVTSLARELGDAAPTVDAVMDRLSVHVPRVFHRDGVAR
jgi:lipoyl(octanoyl) transferase